MEPLADLTASPGRVHPHTELLPSASHSELGNKDQRSRESRARGCWEAGLGQEPRAPGGRGGRLNPPAPLFFLKIALAI